VRLHRRVAELDSVEDEREQEKERIKTRFRTQETESENDKRALQQKVSKVEADLRYCQGQLDKAEVCCCGRACSLCSSVLPGDFARLSGG
jgi:hypothetical protein